MPRWLSRALTRIRELAAAGRVRFTLKARRELASLEGGLDELDACAVLAALTGRESALRVRSETTGEWMYVFKPRLGRLVLYVEVILRNECILVSFHEDEDGGDEEGEE